MNATLFSPYTDIYLNLALEQHLARTLPPGHRLLFFWVNAPAVVFGRFQNPWAECRVDLLATAGAVAARRYSGGGTVYHDTGTLNYSIIASRGELDIPGNLKVLAASLRRNGLDARIGARRDLFIGPDKISGSAFQLSGDFAIHHGTLLIQTDLSRLRALLERSPERLDPRSVPSVPSPVVNIGDADGCRDPRFWAGQLRQDFERFWGGFVEDLPSLPTPSQLTAEYQKLSDPQWIFGQTRIIKEASHAISGI